MISPRKARKFFSPSFIFQLSGCALVAPSCFALQVSSNLMLQRDVELATIHGRTLPACCFCFFWGGGEGVGSAPLLLKGLHAQLVTCSMMPYTCEGVRVSTPRFFFVSLYVLFRGVLYLPIVIMHPPIRPKLA